MAEFPNGCKVPSPPTGQLPFAAELEILESPFERWLRWAEILLHLNSEEPKKPN